MADSVFLDLANVALTCGAAWRGPCASTDRDRTNRQLQGVVSWSHYTHCFTASTLSRMVRTLSREDPFIRMPWSWMPPVSRITQPTNGSI